MSDDLDNESEFGRVTWLSSEEDGGPDVGVVLGLGEGRSLFIGELPNITLQEHGLDPNDGSWWLSMYEPDDHIILGPVRNEDGARDVFDRLFAVLQQSLRLTQALAEAEAALEKIASPFGDFAEGEPTARKASLWHSMAIEQSDIAAQALSTIRAAGGGRDG